MYDELSELGRATVGIATVPEEKFREMAELGHREVGR